jgi:ribosomal protein S18 acetylase RimI-like enzyme
VFAIREINPDSSQEIDLVASRMRSTLVDVLGKDKGESMYTMDWLRDRVMWHLSPDRDAKVFLAEENSEIVAPAIVRVEKNDNDISYGYFSTIYVATKFRNKGIATKLIQTVEAWCSDKKLPYVTYNTADDNDRLIELFKRLSYEIVARKSEMVQLKKSLNQ